MNRRDLLIVLGGSISTLSIAARAQQKGMPVIGYPSSNTPEIPVGEVAAFKAGLTDAGFAEGRGPIADRGPI